MTKHTSTVRQTGWTDRAVAGAWLILAWAQGRYGEWLSWGLMIESGLIAWLFLRRQEATQMGTRRDGLLAVCMTLLPLAALRPTNTGWLHGALIIEWLALIWLLWSLLALGRQFGMAPAYRGSICMRGPYRIVRHPLYLGSIMFVAGYVIGHPSVSNIGVWLLLYVGQVYRADREEALLGQSADYLMYRDKVRGRFAPYWK